MAGWRGLEPPTSGVTGQRCNQLYYHPAFENEICQSPSRIASFSGNFFFQPHFLAPKGVHLIKACPMRKKPNKTKDRAINRENPFITGLFLHKFVKKDQRVFRANGLLFFLWARFLCLGRDWGYDRLLSLCSES